MKKHCSVLSVLSAIAGIVFTVVNAVRVKDVGFMWILVMLLVGGLLTYFLVVPWAIYGEVLERLEFLQSRLDDMSRNQYAANSSIVQQAGQWKCPVCGKVNEAYVGTCSCGRNKSGEVSAQGGQAGSYLLPSEHKFCASCGKPLDAGAKFCAYCRSKVEV